MKQKFDDLVLLLKNDRKYQFLLFAALLALLWAALHTPSAPVQPRGIARPAQLGTGTTGAEESFRDLMTAFKGDIEELKKGTRENQIDIQTTKKQMEDNNARVSDIFNKMLERMAENDNAKAQRVADQSTEPEAEGSGDPNDPANDQMASVSASEGQTITEFQPLAPAVVAPPPPPEAKRVAVVGAGDSVRVKLDAAVHAATDGTPYPVRFRLISDVRGPNDSNLGLGEGFLIAAAQGSLVDSRALFRLSSLNIAYPDGRRNVLEVDGWIVGEDGINGMEGVLIDPIGKAIAATGMAGGLQGLGEAFAAENVTTEDTYYGSQVSVTGSEGEYAAGKALSGAAGAWSRLVESRASKLSPVVEVLSGREGTAIFARSFKIPGLIEAYQLDEDSHSSLD